ncbi:hypothetical protein EV421DRAFT_186513 [Armillaria borealis]|uniref:Uncharacterized protein n=1 Tax=Armillaria borealis TaxID=47425 RepID=A0AA39JRG9_9AGAR|nr:hypothetical protein EV421DRAFT_186513 [Armillaria borealis]
MESYRTLPKDLRPPRNLSVGFRHGSRKALAAITNLPPHDLPEGFFPCQTDLFTYQPPKLNFGWVTPEASTRRVLESKARELIGMATFRYPYEEPVQVYSSHSTMKKVADYLAREFGTSLRLYTEDVITESPLEIIDCITMTSNYPPDGPVPSQEHIKILKNFLEIEEEPCWYMNYAHGYWGKRRIVDMGNGDFNLLELDP